MPNEILWDAPSSATTVINHDATAPTLKNAASNAQVLSNEVDNATSLEMFIDIEIRCRYASAPAAGAHFAIYLISALDGTNYADGSASVNPPESSLIGVIGSQLVATQQRLAPLVNIPIPPLKFKLLVRNAASQALTNTDNENEVRVRLHGPEIQ